MSNDDKIMASNIGLQLVVDGLVNPEWTCRVCGKKRKEHFPNPYTYHGSEMLCEPPGDVSRDGIKPCFVR